MFPGIDDIDWASLEHAYGEASDVPPLLRQLTGSKAKEALDELFGNIYHQGTVYPATVEAIPFLVEALAHTPERAGLLSLLAACVFGYGYVDVHSRSELWKSFSELAQREIHGQDSADDAIRREIETVTAVTRQVYRAWDQAIGLLDDSDVNVRLAATELLAALAYCDQTSPVDDLPERFRGIRPVGAAPGAHAARLVGLLERKLASSDRTDVADEEAALGRAGWLACLASASDRKHPLLRPGGATSVSIFERHVVLVAALADPEPTAEVPVEILGAYLEAIDELMGGDTTPWFVDSPARVALAGYISLSDEAAIELSGRFATWIKHTPDVSFLDDLDLLIEAVLGTPTPTVGDPASVQAWRLPLIESFVNRPATESFSIWNPSNGTAAAAFDARGLPKGRGRWRKWVSDIGKRVEDR